MTERGIRSSFAGGYEVETGYHGWLLGYGVCELGIN